MIVVMNRIPVAEGREQEFESSFTGGKSAVNQMPGFIEMQVLRPSEGHTYLVVTRWASREDFQNWIQSEAFVAAHQQQSPGLLDGRPALEIYEVFAN